MSKSSLSFRILSRKDGKKSIGFDFSIHGIIQGIVFRSLVSRSPGVLSCCLEAAKVVAVGVMNIESKRTLIGEVEKLLDHELYESAETLCTFYASHLTAVEFKPAPAGESISLVLAEIYELLADALHRGKQFKRALHYYRTANHRRKSAQQPKFRSQTTTFSSEEAILKFKECKCLVALRDLSSALKGLEGIPAKFRTAPVHLLLANLYKRGNRRPNAIAAYKEALALLPHAIEIIQHLVDLGVEASEILATVDDALRYKESASLISDGWLHSLVTAMVLKRNHEFEKSMSHLQRLTATFPKNSYLLTHQVQVATEMDLLDQAMAFYRQVRKLDTHILHGAAEVFGRLLYLREDAAELSKLTDDVLDACPHVPAGWLLAAMFSAVKGESESALAFIDKVCNLLKLVLESIYPVVTYQHSIVAHSVCEIHTAMIEFCVFLFF